MVFSYWEVKKLAPRAGLEPAPILRNSQVLYRLSYRGVITAPTNNSALWFIDLSIVSDSALYGFNGRLVQRMCLGHQGRISKFHPHGWSPIVLYLSSLRVKLSEDRVHDSGR